MPGDTYEAESNSELGSGLLCNLKRCSGYSYIIRDRMLCVRGSQGQVMLPLSSYDSSLDLTETFPISPHLSQFLFSLCFSSFHPVPLQHIPLQMWITSWAQFTVFALTTSLLSFHAATMRFTPNEVEQHTDRQISQIRDQRQKKWRRKEGGTRGRGGDE